MSIKEDHLRLELLDERAFNEGLEEHISDLLDAMRPFVFLVKETNGNIPVGRLSFANWHTLAKAYDAAAFALHTLSPATGAGAPATAGESAPAASTTCDQCGKRTTLWYRKFDMDLCAVCAPKVAAAIHRWAKKKKGGFPR